MTMVQISEGSIFDLRQTIEGQHRDTGIIPKIFMINKVRMCSKKGK